MEKELFKFNLFETENEFIQYVKFWYQKGFIVTKTLKLLIVLELETFNITDRLRSRPRRFFDQKPILMVEK